MKFRICEIVSLCDNAISLVITNFELYPFSLSISSRIELLWASNILVHEKRCAVVMSRFVISKRFLWAMYAHVKRFRLLHHCRSSHLLLSFPELHDLCRCYTMRVRAIPMSTLLLWNIVDHIFNLIEFVMDTLDGLYIRFTASLASWKAKIETRSHRAVLRGIETFFVLSTYRR